MISDNAMDSIVSLPLMEKLPGGSKQGSIWPKFWKGTGSGWNPIWDCQVCQNAHALAFAWTSLPVLGWKSSTTRHAKLQNCYQDWSDCNNIRDISLLNIVGKAFARVLLKRLHKLTESVPESQYGFRSERSTINIIFSLRQQQENCRE